MHRQARSLESCRHVVQALSHLDPTEPVVQLRPSTEGRVKGFGYESVTFPGPSTCLPQTQPPGRP